MKLKGEYSSGTEYSVGDVVRFTDGRVYHLQKPCPAGVPPVNTRYWGEVGQVTSEAVHLILDGIDISNSDDPTNISDDAILLKSSTKDSDKEFIITVDDDGELTATEVEATEADE